ncbi:MAG: DUF4835 family protein [Bacteroides sp.]|nr:DUF4835 family protein [Bacteroides sp.]
MMRVLLLSVLAMFSFLGVYAQELNCQVTVDYSQVGGTNTSVFETLQAAISDYVNTRKWTPAQISPNEKIECKLFFTIKEYNDDRMVGDLQVQSSRPVYNSSYTTTLINFKDTKVEFEYREGEPLIFSENSMESNLTAIIDFYVYLILAMDFDSFSPRGGEPFYRELQRVVQMAQSSGESGWKAFEDTKNRSAVLSAFTDPATSKLRDLIYRYHRKGLDEMSVSPAKGRAVITESLDVLKEVFSQSPMSVGLSMFKDAKLDELVNLYTKSPQNEREGAYETLYSIYPVETTRLEMIKRGVNK